MIVTPFENRMAERGTRLPDLADYFANRGTRVEYLTSNYSHAYKRHFSRTQIERAREQAGYQLTIVPIPAYHKNVSIRRVFCNQVFAVKTWLWLLKNLRKGDVVVAPSRPVELILAVALAVRLRGVGAVLDIRDIWPDALVTRSRLKRAVFSAYCHSILHVALPLLTHFVHISPSFETWLQRYKRQARSSFLPPGYEKTRWLSSKPRVGPVEPGKLSLVFVGLLQLQLDVMPVLEAIEDRPDVSFTIVGDDGTGERYQDVMKFVSSRSNGNVTVKGRLSPEDVVRELVRHDVAVVPMVTNSIPNKVFDAIASYMPLLVLGNKDCAQFVESQGIGWGAEFTSSSVADLLDKLSGEELMARQKAVAQVRQRWSRDVLFERFSEVVEEALR